MALRNLSLNKTLLLLLGTFTLAFLTFALVSWRTIETVRINGTLYASIIEGKDLIADILPPPAYIIESHLLTLQLIDEKEPARQAELIDRGNGLRVEFEKRHEYWTRTLAPGPLGDTMNIAAYRPAFEYYQIRDNELVPAVLARDQQRVAAALTGLKQRYEEHRKAVDEVVKLTTARNLELEQLAESSLSSSQRNLFLLGALVVAVVIGLAWITRGMAQSLNGRLALAASVAARVAEGDLTVRVPETGTTDESGRLLAAIQTMTANLHNLVARVRQTSLNLGESAIEFSLSGKRQETSVGGLRDSAVQIAGTARGISDTSSVLMTTMDAVNTVASHTAQVASGGRSSLDELNGAMQELQQATSSISTRASALFAKRPPTSAASSRRSPRSPIRPICFPSMPPSKRKKPAIKASDS